jgi:hypothetical protein
MFTTSIQNESPMWNRLLIGTEVVSTPPPLVRGTQTPDDGLLRSKHVVVLCSNILTDNIDICIYQLFVELTSSLP